MNTVECDINVDLFSIRVNTNAYYHCNVIAGTQNRKLMIKLKTLHTETESLFIQMLEE